MLIVGLIVLMFSRTLDAYTEEESEQESQFNELFYGPPGYYRAVGMIFGVVMMIFGVIGLFRFLLFP